MATTSLWGAIVEKKNFVEIGPNSSGGGGGGGGGGRETLGTRLSELEEKTTADEPTEVHQKFN